MRRTWLLVIDAMRLPAIFERFAVVADASVVPRYFPDQSRLPLHHQKQESLPRHAPLEALPHLHLLSSTVHSYSLAKITTNTMSYYFTIIGTRDNPLFEHEFGTSKAGGDGVARFRHEARHMNQFIVHSSLDIVEEVQWGNNGLYVFSIFCHIIDLDLTDLT
jgi:hypothetical protein